MMDVSSVKRANSTWCLGEGMSLTYRLKKTGGSIHHELTSPHVPTR